MNWLTTFSRFPPGRTPLGPVDVRVEDWSHPKAGEAPMFDHPVLECLSVAHPALPLLVYLPAGIALIWYGAHNGLAPSLVGVAYLGGVIAWTLTEYVTHRISFHHVPTTRWQVAYVYLVHGIHHAYPDDSRRWMIPVVASIPIAAVFFGLFMLVLGRFASPAFGGFLHGYLAYDLLHHAIHRGRMSSRVGRFLRQYHLAHHYASPDRHYGVTSPFWDLVFRTK